MKIGKRFFAKNIVVLSVLFFQIFFLMESIGRGAEVKHILLLETMPVPAVLEHSEWFVEQMHVLGYRQGENMDLIKFNAEGDRQKAIGFIRDRLNTQKPDLVVTNATLASQAVFRILKKEGIPQLFFTVADPVGAGLITAVGQPSGTNITGRVYTLDRRLKITSLMRLIEQATERRPIRIGMIYSSYPSSVGVWNQLSALASARQDIVMVPYQLEYRKVPEGISDMLADVKKGIDALEDKVDYWWEPAGPLGELYEYTDLLMEISSHPIAFGNSLQSVKQGALLHMSPDREKYGRETANVAHEILNGTEPGSIPPVPPLGFLLAFNVSTALKLNIVVPSDLFELAGSYIYR